MKPEYDEKKFLEWLDRFKKTPPPYPMFDGDHYEAAWRGALESVSDGWIPVADRLPCDGEKVLTWDVGGLGWRTYRHGDASWGEVTHWMPMPEGPKE